MSSNLIAALRNLAGGPNLYVAQVLQVHPDGTSTVQVPGGGPLRVRGTQVAVGSPAFVRGTLIEGAAPALTPVVIEI